MQVRPAASPKDVKHYTTSRLREEFLIDNLFQKDDIPLYTSQTIFYKVTRKLYMKSGEKKMYRSEPK